MGDAQGIIRSATPALVSDLLPVDDAGQFASAKLKALGWALGGILTLCLLVIAGSLVATQRESVAIATEREQAQVRNGLLTTIADKRAGLTSVTFWDEAAQKTGVRFDRRWAEENIGTWLAGYYGVEDSFVLNPAGTPLLASHLGKTVASDGFTPLRPFVDPMLRKIRAKLPSYRPGAAKHAFGTLQPRSIDRLDEATVVTVGGAPRLLIAAPILPDFGHLGARLEQPAILVATYRFDGQIFDAIGRDLMLRDFHFSPRHAPLARGTNRLGLAINGEPQTYDLRWTLQSRGTDLIKRSLPIVAALFLVLMLVSLAGSRFVRESAQALYASRIEAMQDELTGLPNRRRLTRLIETETDAGAAFSLLFIDLDRFKDVNDLWGHAAGDDLIREAAGRLTAIVGREMVGRFGGDEFVMVVRGDRLAAEHTGEMVLTALREPFTVGPNLIVLAGSVGIAKFPKHGHTAGDLMRKADLALYRAKSLGKDRLVVFDSSMEEGLLERQALENDLRRAVSERELSVDFQPQYARGTRALVGVEALARWRRPDGRTIGPAIFVPLAEDLGLISTIDAMILEIACAQAAQWDEIILAVNVSPGQLHSPGYAEAVLRTLERTGLPPQRLRLEITETALFGHMGQVAQTVTDLRATGVRFAIDDFGTGFSSLDRLRMLKLDDMKIDRSFVADLGRNPDCPSLITSMIALGHALGLTVTAEGVETAEQFALLEVAGCDEFQGNLLSLPVSAAAIEPLLGRCCTPDALTA